MGRRRIKSRIEVGLNSRKARLSKTFLKNSSFYFDINWKNYIAYAVDDSIIIVGDFWHEQIAEIDLATGSTKKLRNVNLKAKDRDFVQEVLEGYQSQKFIKYDNSHRAYIIRSHHFAHHIWNEMSELEELLAESDEEISLICIGWPLGKLEDIFFEHSKRMKCYYVDNQSDVLKVIQENNLFIFPLGGVNITKSVVQRISNYARNNTDLEFKYSIDSLREETEKIFAISLKLNSKTLLDSKSFTAELIDRIDQNYDKCGFILYGFLFNMKSRTQKDLKYNKLLNRLANEILLTLNKNIKYRTIIGCNLLETIYAMNNIDFYISHVGTLHHLPAWFSQKKGIIHGSTKYLGRPIEEIPGTWEFADIPKTNFVDLHNVLDNEDVVKQRGKFNEVAINYRLKNIEGLVNQVREIIV